MGSGSWSAFSDADLHTLAEQYIERAELVDVTVDQILGDQSRLTNSFYLLGMIEEILIGFDGYPVYEAKTDHLLQSFRSTLQNTGPLPSQVAYRQDLIQSMSLATLIRPLTSTGGVRPTTVAATSLGSRLEVLFEHVDEVLSDYECGGAIYAAPEYQWPHLTDSLRSVVERADSKVIEACLALINAELTFSEEFPYVYWHQFTTEICHRASLGSGGFLDAHHVWLLLKSYASEYPAVLLPIEVRRKHELAVALYQTALDCFAPNTRDS